MNMMTYFRLIALGLTLAATNSVAAEPPRIAITGTLVVKPVQKGTIITSYWVYINGQLVASHPASEKASDRLKTMSFQLLGADNRSLEYRVEVLALRYFDGKTGQDFPFIIRSQTAKIRNGESTTVECDVSLNPYGSLGFLEEEGGFSGLPEEGPSAGWLAGLGNDVQRAAKAYESDPPVVALIGVLSALQQAPPIARTVRVNFPAVGECGGSREFNSAQIGELVKWVKFKHWSWFPTLNDSSLNFEKKFYAKLAQQPAWREQYEKILAYVSQWKESADRLKGIGKMLDAVDK